MSLKSRISEWRAGSADKSEAISIRFGEKNEPMPLIIRRYDAQLLAKVLSRGKDAFDGYVTGIISMGIGMGLLIGLLFVPDSLEWGFFVAVFIFLFGGLGILAWFERGFRYQRGVP